MGATAFGARRGQTIEKKRCVCVCETRLCSGVAHQLRVLAASDKVIQVDSAIRKMPMARRCKLGHSRRSFFEVIKAQAAVRNSAEDGFEGMDLFGC